MLNSIRKIFAPPLLDDEEKPLQAIRRRNLVRIAGLAAALSLPTALYDIYLGFTSRTGYYLLAAGILTLLFIVSVAIIQSRRAEKPFFGVWHLLTLLSIVFMLSSSLQSNVGAEMGAALLVIVLVVSIQTLPPKQVIRGAILGIVASIIASFLVFYSPFPQEADPRIDVVTIWIARGATLAVLAFAMMQFRTLNISNKLLTAFLGVVVAISLTFNIVQTNTASRIITNQVSEEIQAVAEARGTLIGDYLRGHIETLQTFALDENIRQSVRVANALKPDQDSILELDESWQQAFESGAPNSLVDSRMSNSLSNDLRAFIDLDRDRTEVFVTDRAGATVSTTSMIPKYYHADDDWWRSAYHAGRRNVYISRPEVDESTGEVSIFIAMPINDTLQGELLGVLRATISFETLNELLALPIGKTGQVDLIFTRRPALALHNGLLGKADPLVLSHIEEVEEPDKFFLTTIYGDVDSIFTTSRIRTTSGAPEVNQAGWKLSIHQDEAEALAPVQEQARLTSFLSTLMAGVTALISLVVSQRLARPIFRLTETAKKIASGNLDARAPVESQDETGQLAETFNTMTAQLKEMLGGLEKRVADRTAELEESSQQLQKRAAQFETIAQLARTISSVQDPELLLPKVTQLVSVSFGFYHVGLFLLDESRQYAVLSAANSEGGQRMLDRKHRLGVGQTGIVGYVTSTGNPRIALDTGVDAVYFDNPDLPDTRSEMALPLRVGTTIVGALDVQSTEPNAFSEDDVEVLSILADVVSVAIENARLFEESQRVLAEAQTAYGEFSQGAWEQLSKRRGIVGYELSGASVRSLTEPLKSNGSSIVVPISLRDRVIGTMNISLPENKDLDPDEVDITHALAQRVGIAIESAILLEESQRAATKEQVIGEITAKIGSSVNLSNVLQTAVEELGQNIPGSEIVIELKSEQNGTQDSVSGEAA